MDSNIITNQLLDILKGVDNGAARREAEILRRKFAGDTVSTCSIINAKSGRCNQNCSFCAQSAFWNADAPEYGLPSPLDIAQAAVRASQGGTTRFSIVTSGLNLSEKELSSVCRAIEIIRNKTSLDMCASLGVLPENELKMLLNAGLSRYHHNLEASQGYYPSICSTRYWETNRQVILSAKDVGLETCCGGIFGLGENVNQQAELLLEIKEISPDGVPINFLVPIEGTPLGGRQIISTEDALNVVVAARLAMPEKEIIICGGRREALRVSQGDVFSAGASGLMTGDYLTLKGVDGETDRKMIEAAGFCLVGRGLK